MAQGFSLKDQLFNLEKTRYLAGLFAQADLDFDAYAFEARVMERLRELELKDRMHWIADCLRHSIPGKLPAVAPTILRALPAPLDPALVDDDFGDFIFAPLGEWVAMIGMEYPEQALDVLEEVTQRFSMEWAIRPFLNRWPDLVLDRASDWCDHYSYHVRRLASEGTRPRLPWGAGIPLNPRDTLPLLDRLHFDSTRYVTRSVANHLNDIARTHPDLAIARLEQWSSEERQTPEELRWMTSHALRGLIKAGHRGAMMQLGFDPEIPLDVTIKAPTAAKIGGSLDFSVLIDGPENQPVLVDYVIHFLRPSGKRSSKVFKLKQAEIGSGTLHLSKSHKLKRDATTFKLMPGLHVLQVQVNGRICDEVEFALMA